MKEKQKTILIVDDSYVTRSMLSQVLEVIGYKPMAASGGFHALMTLQKHHVDAIILDLMMPDMNGFEVYERLQHNPTTAHIPVIMLTAKIDTLARKKALALGIDTFLTKPFRIDEIEVALRHFFEKTPQPND
jgi:CheY-like chemotaxis protein